jgi:zinc protease
VSARLESGRTRSYYLVNYACDPQNVGKAAAIVARDIHNLTVDAPAADKLERAKMQLLQQIVLGEGSVEQIARTLLTHQDLGLPINESQIAAKAYIDLTPQQVQAAFAKWMRPPDLIRVSQGPAPQ